MSGLEWIAVDWGTSNVRAWGIGADGEIHFTRESPEGMGKLQPGDYPASSTGSSPMSSKAAKAPRS